jgi:hypothetical protein
MLSLDDEFRLAENRTHGLRRDAVTAPESVAPHKRSEKAAEGAGKVTERMFTCPRQPGGLRITPNYCRRVWPKAQNAKKGDRLFPCRGCPIGAAHCDAEIAVSLAEPRHTQHCVRCERPTRKLVRDRLCVSCANREYEYIKGRNGKGSVPKRHPALRAVRLRVHDGQAWVLREFSYVASAREAVLGVAWRTSRRTLVGFAAGGVQCRP